MANPHVMPDATWVGSPPLKKAGIIHGSEIVLVPAVHHVVLADFLHGMISRVDAHHGGDVGEFADLRVNNRIKPGGVAEIPEGGFRHLSMFHEFGPTAQLALGHPACGMNGWLRGQFFPGLSQAVGREKIDEFHRINGSLGSMSGWPHR